MAFFRHFNNQRGNFILLTDTIFGRKNSDETQNGVIVENKK